jgi:hypothetical protein
MMDASTISAAKDVGIWGLVIILVVQFAVSMGNKILPNAVKHARDMEERKVAAEEAVAKAITVGNERMITFEKLLTEYGNGHSEINKSLAELMRGMAILMDRRERIENNPKPGKEKREHEGLF